MPVQLSDLLAHHLDGVDAAVGLDPTATAAISALGLHTGVDTGVNTGVNTGPGGPGALLVASIGPDTDGSPLAAAPPAPGARVLVLFGFAADPVPLHLLRTLAPGARLQLLAAGAVETPDSVEDVFGAALLTCVETSAELESLTADDEDDTDGSVDAMSGAAATARYERALAGRDRRIQSLEQRISALESSATYVVGRTLVNAARNPRKARALPAELWGMWKGRAGKSRTGGDATPAAPVPSRGLAARQVHELDDVDSALLYLTHTAMAIGPRTVPVVAGILTAATAPVLRGPADAPHAVVNTLLPHDGEGIVTRTDPDVLLIESAALGAPGPWAYTTQGAYGARDQALVDIISATRALGRPVVVWWNSPHSASPGLNRVAAQADLVRTDTECSPALIAELNAQLDLGFDLAVEELG